MTLFPYVKSVNFHELVKTFQGFVSILSDWLNTNKLVPHESKIKLIADSSCSACYSFFFKSKFACMGVAY